MKYLYVHNKDIRKTATVLIPLLFLIFPSISEAILSSDVVYCNALGYTYIVEQTEFGERGLCQLPDGQLVDAQDFVVGKVALNWSYCALNGFEARHVESSEVCKNCCVCVLDDGSEIMVTKLMGLYLEESKCGDGTCGVPESFETCPADCPSGGWDGYCDGAADGKVDPDCAEGEDPDSPVRLTFYRDADKDGFGDATSSLHATSAPDGYVADSSDCDDENAAVNPGGQELCCDGVDNNCDGQIDEGCCCMAVGDLAARAKSGKVQLTWTHIGVDSYNIYRRIANGEYELIADTTSNYSTYLDANVTNGITYQYRIGSLCNGGEGEPSNEVSATPTERTRRR